MESASHCAPSRPYSTWSLRGDVGTLGGDRLVDGDDDDALGDRLLDDRVELLAVGRVDDDRVDALRDQVLEVLRSARSGPPFLEIAMTSLTWPLASDWALTAQIISSRQPLPASVLLTPMT